MEVICLEDRAFFAMIEEVVARLSEKHSEEVDKWINDEQAMKILDIKAKSTLQKLRDEGKIRFSQPQKKIILYDRASLNEFLEHNARERF